jgi:hypothetical protein
MWVSIAVRYPGWRIPWWTTSKNPSGARSAAGADHSTSERSACRRDIRRSNPRDDVAQAGGGERGEEAVTVHAGQRDGGNSERCDGCHATGRVEGHPERPHPAQRRADDRHLREVERVKQRGEFSDGVLAEWSAAVVEGVTQPEPGEVEGDQPMRFEIGHERRPCRGAHAAAVHEHERRAIARLQDPHRNLRVGETHAPATDLHAGRRKQPALASLEGHR